MTDLTTEMVPGQDSQDLYRAEDAQAILGIAIAQHTEDGELTRTQLLEIAEELGISALTLAEAEQKWQLQQLEESDRTAFNEFRTQRFQSHLVRFMVINSMVVLVNLRVSGTVSWALYLLLAWGAVIGLQGWHTFQPNTHRYRQEFETWRRRQKLKRSFNRFIDWLLGTDSPPPGP